MMEEFKSLRYKFKEQKLLYNKYKNKISNTEKFKLVGSLIEENIFAYLEGISVIIFDIAEPSEKYIEVLEKITDKIKSDLAQGPFLTALKNIGLKKKRIGVDIYKMISKCSKNETLIILSGLILGGYTRKHEAELIKLLNKKSSNLITISYLKAILITYENKRLPEEIYVFLNNIEKSRDEKSLMELANLSLAFYNKDKIYFYTKIFNLVKLNNNNITGFIFNKLTYSKLLNKTHRYNLIDYSKDSNEDIIESCLMILKNYPKDYKKNSKLIIYWLNKGLKHKLEDFDWVLEELSNKNKLYINYFLDNFREIKNGEFYLPELFGIMSKQHISYSIKQLTKLSINEENEKKLFYRLSRKIIGNIYINKEHFDDLVILLQNIIKIVQDRDFIDFNEKRFKKKSINKTQENYDYLINLAYELLNQLQERDEKYDIPLIRKNLEKYTILYNYAKVVIDKCESKKEYSPLLWLGKTEKPDLTKIKFSETDDELTKAFKLESARGEYLSRAYLDELNSSLRIVDKYSNGKSEKLVWNNEIIKKLSCEKEFWDFFSELIFIKKFDLVKGIIKEIEPKLPNKKNDYLDLKINLFKKDIYFERALDLDNGAIGISNNNKVLSIINRKIKRQVYNKKTYKEIEKGKRKDIFFLVMDTSSSAIEEYTILDTFFGSLTYNWRVNKKTGELVSFYVARKKDSINYRNKKSGLISGIIYFKKELVFIKDNPKIILRGDIIQNPNAMNKLSKKEIKKLKSIIFRLPANK